MKTWDRRVHTRQEVCRNWWWWCVWCQGCVLDSGNWRWSLRNRQRNTSGGICRSLGEILIHKKRFQECQTGWVFWLSLEGQWGGHFDRKKSPKKPQEAKQSHQWAPITGYIPCPAEIMGTGSPTALWIQLCHSGFNLLMEIKNGFQLYGFSTNYS